MKKMTKKYLSGLVACMLLVGATGCGSSPSKDSAAQDSSAKAEGTVVSADTPGWQTNSDDKVKLQWYVNFSWFTTPWGGNAVSDTITEETGVDLEFIVPAGNEAEKLNAMIASDTLPDLLTLGWWEPQIKELISSDMVYALNELADEYDPYFFKVADESRVGWYTQEDGNIYAYPNSSYSPADYEKYDNIPSNQTFLVRKDMYEAIGSPDMSTPEGFISALEKAKEMFPDVNGQPLIPLGLEEFTETGNNALQKYLQDFLAVPYEKDGQLYDRTTDEDYIEWLKAFNEMNRKGLLANDIFIDKRAQMEEKIAQGRYFAMLYQRTDMAAQQKVLYANDPDSIYIAVDGPKNAAGDDHTLPGTGIQGWTVTLISKNCKNPDRAIQMMTYLMSEHGQKMVFLGPEGVTYDMVDGQPVVKEDIKTLLNTDRAAYDKQYAADDAYWMLQDNAMQLQWAEEPQEPLKQMQEWTYPYVTSISQYEDVNPLADSEESVISLKIGSQWGKTLTNLLLADSEEEFDKIFNEFLAKRESLGFEKLYEYQNGRMQENKEKLGLE